MSNKQTDGGSATPEGKPTPEELALDIGRKLVAAHRLSGFIEATKIIAPAIAARDALHAETLASLRDDLELAKAANDGGNELLLEARTALEHGEARERLLREALERIAEYEIDWREGPGYNVGVLQRRAEDALATAQAMKEETR